MNNLSRESHVPYGESTDLSAFLVDLVGLDGRYGPLESRADGTLVSNDTGYPAIAPDVISRLPRERSGIGLFIGGGGALSMLPELPVEAIAFVDKNPFVGDFSRLLAESILASDTPNETLTTIESKYRLGQYAVLRGLRDRYDDLDRTLFSEFRVEAREYGKYHWSEPGRFAQVKEALSSIPVVTVGADITNPGFAPALGNTLSSHGRTITFANFTNVHAWVDTASMEFVRDLPFHTNAMILYSSNKDVRFGDWPKMAYATSPIEYLDAIQDKATGPNIIG